MLGLNTGKFLCTFEKLPDLNSINVSEDGELLFLGRKDHGDERKELEEETPAEINRRFESLAEIVHSSKEDIPLTDIRRLSKIQIGKIADLNQFCQNNSE